jgi:hypothetical protein
MFQKFCSDSIFGRQKASLYRLHRSNFLFFIQITTMMDDGRGSLGSGSLFGGGRQSNLTGLSPYLNVDPSYLSSQTPEFIFNQDTKRGRLENSFTAIGSSLILGAVGGGAYGLFDGVRHTGLAEMSGKLRRTQILNHTLKSGMSI